MRPRTCRPQPHRGPLTAHERWLQDRIKMDGTAWVMQQRFWLFGTCTYADGSRITPTRANKDACHFFNKLDRAILARRDYNEKRRLPRLVFLEKGANGDNIHFHFLIKGTNLKQYRHIKWKSEEIWPTIHTARDILMLDANSSDADLAFYGWKHFYVVESDTLMVQCCHIDRPRYS